ncbi:hypothetical protein EZS27_030296, partial [termite gut metagenome]
YIKQDGTITYTYSPNDLVVAGDELPKYLGNAGITTEYKGVGINITLRFLGGADYYNNTLVNRVENIDPVYNVDKRVLTGRWQERGQETQYKKLGTFQYEGESVNYPEVTRPTTRFIQKRDELDIAAVSLYYEFPHSYIEKLFMQRLRLSFYMNDIHKFSSIRVERGTQYPFARNMSFSLTTTF